MVISLAWQFLKLLAGYFLWQSTPGTPAEHLCCCWSRIMPREPGASMNKGLYPNQMSSLKQDTYAAIVDRIHQHVDRAVPAGSTVVMVSKGDERLLQINQSRGWHFPQNSEGTYSGYYPENDIAAISHLEALRSRGAQFLVVPATAFWWFDHYAGFNRHLRALYAVVLDDKETCT